MAARGSSGVLDARHFGGARRLGNRGEIPAEGLAWNAPIRAEDDGWAFALWLQRRDPLFPEAGDGNLRGHTVPGADGRQPPGPFADLGVSPQAFGGAGGSVLAGLPDLSAREAGRAGQRGPGGTKVQASASKHKASHGRMFEEEERFKEERSKTHESKKERVRSETLAEKWDEETARLRQEADEQAGEDAGEAETPEGMPKHRPKTQTDGTPKPKAQRNFTDPDSRIMEKGDRKSVV